MYKKMAVLPMAFWMVCGIALPLLLVVYYGLTNIDGGFTLENIAAAFEPVHLRAIGLSLVYSAMATIVCFIMAFPLAVILRKLGKIGSRLMTFIFFIPMWVNSLLRIQAWQVILDKNGLLDTVLGFLSLPYRPVLNTPAAVVIGMVYDFFPFMLLPIYNQMVKIDESVLEAAADLGASNGTIMRKVVLPLTSAGIVSGVTMTFMPALTTFAITDLLGGGKVFLIGNIIEQEFTTSADWNLGSGLSLVMMLFIVIGMVVSARFGEDVEGENEKKA
ncbi:MAG: ABC transporter permease [Eubacteriales bacterium]|nr:ABC transporter permease [Eubacteriales bacterium]